MSILSRLLAGWYIQIFHKTLIDRNRDRRHPESGRITKEDIKTMTRDTFDNYQRLIVNVDLWQQRDGEKRRLKSVAVPGHQKTRSG